MGDAIPQSDAWRLDALIARRDVTCRFQPLVDLSDGSIMGFEALSRPGPESGFADPAVLFKAASEHKRLWDLEALTRSVSLEAARSWPAHTRLFLNTTPDVFADKRFAASLESAIERTPGLLRERLVLEITELSDDQHIPGLIEQVASLRLAGFHVAIDDAGAGASGLVRMLALRPQWIKLDREFVQGIDVDLYRQNLVRFFVQFGRMSGVQLVAEGIETRDELSTIMGLGVRYGQGFFLARPVERDAIASPALAQSVREHWQAAEAHLPTDPFNLPLVRLVNPVVELQRSARITDAVDALARTSGAIGVLFRDGRRVCGFAWRQEIALATAMANDRTAIDRFCERPVCQLGERATIQEALQLACLIDEDAVADPIILTTGLDVVGAVRLRDLLRAAAYEGRLGHSWKAPVTGLPSRIRADQHLHELILRHRGLTASSTPSTAIRAVLHADAAIIDIRRFDDYNALVGYELGDKLIRDVADQIASTVIVALGDAFFAHLGDDRFLVTAPNGLLEPVIRKLVAGFDRFSDALPRLPSPQAAAGPSGPAADLPGTSHVRLRVMLMPGAIPTWTHPRDLYRAEAAMRAAANSRAEPASDASIVLIDQRAADRVPLRLSA